MIGKIFQRKSSVTQKEKNQLAHSLAAKKAEETHSKAKARLMKDHFEFYIKSWRKDLLSLLQDSLTKDEINFIQTSSEEQLLDWIEQKLKLRNSTYVTNKLSEIHSELRLLVMMQKEIQSPNLIAFHYHLACLHEEVEYMLSQMQDFCQKFTLTMEEAIESAFQEFIHKELNTTGSLQSILQKASIMRQTLLQEEELDKMVSYVYDVVGKVLCEELKSFTQIPKDANLHNPSVGKIAEEERVVPKVFNAEQYKELAHRLKDFSDSFQKENLKKRLKARIHDLVDV